MLAPEIQASNTLSLSLVAPKMNTHVGSVRVAATQMSCSIDHASNMDKANRLVREAAAQGAQIILLQELFHGLYFCQVL